MNTSRKNLRRDREVMRGARAPSLHPPKPLGEGGWRGPRRAKLALQVGGGGCFNILGARMRARICYRLAPLAANLLRRPPPPPPPHRFAEGGEKLFAMARLFEN